MKHSKVKVAGHSSFNTGHSAKVIKWRIGWETTKQFQSSNELWHQPTNVNCCSEKTESFCIT